MANIIMFALGMFIGGIVGFAVSRCCMAGDRNGNGDGN